MNICFRLGTAGWYCMTILCFHFFRWHCLGQGHLVARPASVGSLTFSFVNE